MRTNFSKPLVLRLHVRLDVGERVIRMTAPRAPRSRKRFAVFLSMLTLLVSLVTPIYPQCPNNTGSDGHLLDPWPQGSTVYFSFDTSVPPMSLIKCVLLLPPG